MDAHLGGCGNIQSQGRWHCIVGKARRGGLERVVWVPTTSENEC